MDSIFPFKKRIIVAKSTKTSSFLVVITHFEYFLRVANTHLWQQDTSVTNNSPSQDSNHPDDFFQSRCVYIHIHIYIYKITKIVRAL